MKVAFAKEAKGFITLDEAPRARQIIADCKEYDIKDLAETAARIAGGQNGYEILKATAEIAKNARVQDYYGYNTGSLDVWLEVYAFSHLNGFYNIGVYLSDLWQLAGDNSDEIRGHMYIEEYKR